MLIECSVGLEGDEENFERRSLGGRVWVVDQGGIDTARWCWLQGGVG